MFTITAADWVPYILTAGAKCKLFKIKHCDDFDISFLISALLALNIDVVNDLGVVGQCQREFGGGRREGESTNGGHDHNLV